MKGHRLSAEDRQKSARTRLLNKKRVAKGLPKLTANQKRKLNAGLLTERQLLGGFDDTMQYVAGFDDTMQYVAGAVKPRRRRVHRVGGVEMGGAVHRRRGRPRKHMAMAGDGVLETVGSVLDGVFGLGEGGVEMGGAVHRRRGRPRKHRLMASGEGGVEMGGVVHRRRGRPRKHMAMAGDGVLESVGSVLDSVFGLGEGEGGAVHRKRRVRKTHKPLGGEGGAVRRKRRVRKATKATKAKKALTKVLHSKLLY